MELRWRYRFAAVGGSTAIVVFAIAIANTATVQNFITSLPILSKLQPVVIQNDEIPDEMVTAVVILLAVLWPLFKPRPRRILDTISLTHKRLLFACALLATIGYFDWSTRLPRTTLIATTVLLSVFLPVWFVHIRRRPQTPSRAIIVGDDPAVMRRLHEAADTPILGFVAPSSVDVDLRGEPLADGGILRAREPTLPRLGGLSQLDEVLVKHDVDTVLLGFEKPDRAEFFGTLSACYDHGVHAKVHRNHADSVLVADAAGGDLVSTDLEPWDWQDHLVKRLFDLTFASVALLLTSPLLILIALAIKLDSPGPILYSQQRTAEFGETFTVYKFRSMVTDAEAEVGATLSSEDVGETDPRVTRVGRILRRTHLDEIPQLWSILVGDMNVVGPRPERPELDRDIESNVSEWRSRWFVKPGLTGLAQINGVTGHEPERKLRYDIEYIRKQSFWFDMKIVVRQNYSVLVDVCKLVGIFDED